MIDPPQNYLLLIETGTPQPHVAELAFSPPTIHATVVELVEHPHDILELHE